jgi:hypothetical protein
MTRGQSITGLRVLLAWAIALGFSCAGAACSGSEATRTDADDAGDGGDDATADEVAPTGVFDCAFVNANNCWKTTVAAAIDCLPPPEASGTLGADQRTCTYASGTVVTFAASPLASSVSPYQSIVPPFTVTTGGVQCLRYGPDPVSGSLLDGTQLTTSAGSVTFTLDYGKFADDASESSTLACPDGTRYVGGTAPVLAQCQAAVPGYDVQGALRQVNGNVVGSLNFFLTGALPSSTVDGASSELVVFSCLPAQ